MQRLRTLQLRLNSVDPGVVQAATKRVLEWRSAAGESKEAEARRRALHAYATGSADGVVTDFERRMHNEFLPRLTQSLRNLLPEIQNRGTDITGSRAEELEDQYNSRVIAVERSSAARAGRTTCGTRVARFNRNWRQWLSVSIRSGRRTTKPSPVGVMRWRRSGLAQEGHQVANGGIP